MLTTSLWHISKQASVLRQEKLCKKNRKQVTIKSLYSLISTGTEKLIASGLVPPSMQQLMKVPFMGGDFNFPIKYGYSLVGKVISEGPNEGQLVHLLHPHQSLLNIDNQSISFIPKGINAKRATLASNMETALNAVWDSQVSVGDKVLVAGFGMIGGLVARLLSMMPAVEVVVLEKNAYRAELAHRMGFAIITHNPENFDISFHTTGTSNGLQTCIDGLGMEGKIIELSWYGTKTIDLQLGGDFHYYRKQIISSQVGHLPITKNARWNYQRRKKVVWALLKNPAFDAHITHEISLSESPAFFEELRKDRVNDRGLGWVIKYD